MIIFFCKVCYSIRSKNLVVFNSALTQCGLIVYMQTLRECRYVYVCVCVCVCVCVLVFRINTEHNMVHEDKLELESYT
jgi:hypothetical protein